MRIGNASKKDYEGVRRLYLQLHPKKANAVPFNGIKFSGRTFVARENGETVGFLMATVTSYFSSKVEYLEEFIVDKKFRGRGIGTRLVKEALKWGAKQGVEVAFVTTEHASKFYQKQGFTGTKGHKWLMFVPKRSKPKRR